MTLQKFSRRKIFIRYNCLFPNKSDDFCLSVHNTYISENQNFDYRLLKTAVSVPEPFFESMEKFVLRLSQKTDADGLLMFYHNLSMQIEELSGYMISFSDPAYFENAEDFCRYFRNQMNDYRNTWDTAFREQYSPVVEGAMQYIRQNYGNHFLTIQLIAEELQISPSRLSVLFKKESGQTVNEYLTNTRIAQSIYLLENTNLRIYEIADQIGYKSSQYFSQAFQQKTGKKPLELRSKSGSLSGKRGDH